MTKYLFIHPEPLTPICLNNIDLLMRAGDVVDLNENQMAHPYIESLINAAGTDGPRLERVDDGEEQSPDQSPETIPEPDQEPAAKPDMNSLTKQELAKWAKDNHGLELDTKKTKKTMIKDLLEYIDENA